MITMITSVSKNSFNIICKRSLIQILVFVINNDIEKILFQHSGSVKCIHLRFAIITLNLVSFELKEKGNAN